MWAIEGGVAVSGVAGAVSTAYRVYRLGPQIDPRFAHHYFRSSLAVAQYRLLVRGVTTFDRSVTREDFEAMPMPVPPLETQRAIADYLDGETTRIDALITKKRRMIELLESRFNSYIRERLSETGPTIPLKRRWKVIDCKHRTPSYVDRGYPVISPGDVTAGRLDLSVAHRFVGQADLEDLAGGDRRPKQGDIIYSRNASIGIAGFVDTDERFCMGQDVCLVTSAEQDQLYLSYVLNSVGMDQLDVQKIGSTFSRVNVAQILELDIPTPNPELQRTLAAEFDVERAFADTTIARLRKQIALLVERRQALITAAVTGELEIPGVAA
jgi:type I restriction enzyme S subunit